MTHQLTREAPIQIEIKNAPWRKAITNTAVWVQKAFAAFQASDGPNPGEYRDLGIERTEVRELRDSPEYRMYGYR